MAERLREIIFDTETTGLSPAEGDRIIEIGAVELIDRIPTGKHFHHYIHPGDRAIHPDAQRVHGISIEDLKDKPSFADIADDFMDFFGEGTLIAHNANFDMGFVNAELAKIDRPALSADRVTDTLFLARRAYPGAKNSLDALCQRFRISNAHRVLHGALLDAELLQEVYIELTGGQQVGMGFAAPAKPGALSQTDAQQAAPTRQRPIPLTDPRTDNTRAAHTAFVKRLGETAVWSRYR